MLLQFSFAVPMSYWGELLPQDGAMVVDSEDGLTPAFPERFFPKWENIRAGQVLQENVSALHGEAAACPSLLLAGGKTAEWAGLPIPIGASAPTRH